MGPSPAHPAKIWAYGLKVTTFSEKLQKTLPTVERSQKIVSDASLLGVCNASQLGVCCACRLGVCYASQLGVCYARPGLNLALALNLELSWTQPWTWPRT